MQKKILLIGLIALLFACGCKKESEQRVVAGKIVINATGSFLSYADPIPPVVHGTYTSISQFTVTAGDTTVYITSNIEFERGGTIVAPTFDASSRSVQFAFDDSTKLIDRFDHIDGSVVSITLQDSTDSNYNYVVLAHQTKSFYLKTIFTLLGATKCRVQLVNVDWSLNGYDFMTYSNFDRTVSCTPYVTGN